MPTYLYSCPVHREFEVEHSIKDKLQECPLCKSENLPSQQVKRIIQKTSFLLRGTGWASSGYS